jgi:hypothetical protein
LRRRCGRTDAGDKHETQARETKRAMLSAESVQSFMALALGFAVAGCFAAGYQFVTQQPVSFRLLHQGPSRAAFIALSVIYFAAPFIIMRNTLNGAPIEDRSFQLTFLATVIAGVWSLMSGTVLVMVLHAVGLLAA